MATVSNHKILDCPVCFKRYISPRVLPCYHTLCEKCLNAHVTSQVGSGTECLCPLCNSPIVPPDLKLSVDKWAKAFPLHSLICSLLESAEVSNNGENICEPCYCGGKTVTADVWCTDCRERLCHSCNSSHRHYKQFKQHNLIPISEMEQGIQLNMDLDQKCIRHRDEALRLYCVDHRKLCCSICIATDHRQCNDVRSIDDLAREQKQRSTSAYPGIISDIKKIKTEMAKVLSSKANNVMEISQEKQQINGDIDRRIDTIIAELNKLRNEFKNETDHLYNKIERSILKNRNIVQTFMTNIENSEEILEIVEMKGSTQQKFVTFENIITQITSHYQQLKSRLTEDTEVRLCMESSKVLGDIEGALKSIDTVQVSAKPSTTTSAILQTTSETIRKANSRININTELFVAQVQKRDMMTSPVTFVKAMTRQKLGAGTRITGGTFCSDGRLLMADYNNNRLLQLDDQHNVVDQYKIDGHPTDVAVGNHDNEIYIAVNKQYIYKCTLDTGLTIVSRIKAPKDTLGIAMSGDNIIVGTLRAVVMLKQDGTTVFSIPRAGHVVIRGISMTARSYVATSQSPHTLCHTDNNNVVCRTLDGKELFKYQHPQLKSPRGICVDKHNTIYTCGRDSHNVHQVSLDGRIGRIIVDNLHSISKPVTVMFHPQRDELIVTSWNEDTVFEVYRLG